MRLSLVHAADDWDIPAEEDDKIFKAVGKALMGDVNEESFPEMKDKRTVGLGKDAFVTEWKEGDVTVRQELFPFGGEFPVLVASDIEKDIKLVD